VLTLVMLELRVTMSPRSESCNFCSQTGYCVRLLMLLTSIAQLFLNLLLVIDTDRIGKRLRTAMIFSPTCLAYGLTHQVQCKSSKNSKIS
jgi:hypothetical protein